MVRQAIELNAGIPGVSFAVNRATDLRQFGDRSFDFVYSAIALQHVPDRGTIEAYIGEFCRLLRPEGLVAFELPSHIPAIFRLQWRRRLYSGLRRLGLDAQFVYRRLHLLPIAMSYIPESGIMRLFESAGVRVLDVETLSASGLLNAGVKSSTYYDALRPDEATSGGAPASCAKGDSHLGPSKPADVYCVRMATTAVEGVRVSDLPTPYDRQVAGPRARAVGVDWLLGALAS